MRLIADDGAQLGVVSTQDALSKAYNMGLDLVLIAPSSKPPVCKIMDYGKYKFEQIKKAKEMKKNSKTTELKEVQLSMTIDTHDIETKARHANRFLTAGNKVKVVLRMRGRQQAYAKHGVEIVKGFFERLSENGTIDREPKINGRNILLIVSPKK